MEKQILKTILIPVDFSDSSVNALNFAVMLAGKLNAKLILYHSFYSPHSGGHLSLKDADQGKKTGKEIALKDLNDLYHRSSLVAGLEVEYVSNANELREELRQLVKERGVDLMVMGTNGISRLAGKFFGTNTSWAIEHVDCPVIAIPDRILSAGISHISYASEYLDSDIVNLQTVHLIARAFSSEITIIHVAYQNTDKEVLQVEQFADKLEKAGLGKLNIRTLVSAGVEEALEAHLKEDTVDLMIMSAHQHGLYDKLLGKSMTRLMVQHLRRPILFFHYRD